MQEAIRKLGVMTDEEAVEAADVDDESTNPQADWASGAREVSNAAASSAVGKR